MSEGYPLLTLPANESYQLAHVATYIASAIARRRAVTGRTRAAFRARGQAVRDLAGGREALARLTGESGGLAASQLPQPIDAATFNTARQLLRGGPRWAEVVSLAPAGGSGWAVLGHVPGLGPVGARVPTVELAEALRQHVLTRPAGELAPWAVTDRARRLPTMPHQVDLPGFVAELDPTSADARAVAAALRGIDQQTDTAIGARFAGIDLDVPVVPRPPGSEASQPVAAPAASSDPAAGHGAGPQATVTSSGGPGAGTEPDPGSRPTGGDTAAPDPAAGQSGTPGSAGGSASAADRVSARPRRERSAQGTGGRGRRPAARQTVPRPTTQDATADEPATGTQPDEPAAPRRRASGAARRAAQVKAATHTTYWRPAAPARPAGQGPGTSAAAAPTSNAGP